MFSFPRDSLSSHHKGTRSQHIHQAIKASLLKSTELLMLSKKYCPCIFPVSFLLCSPDGVVHLSMFSWSSTMCVWPSLYILVWRAVMVSVIRINIRPTKQSLDCESIPSTFPTKCISVGLKVLLPYYICMSDAKEVEYCSLKAQSSILIQ